MVSFFVHLPKAAGVLSSVRLFVLAGASTLFQPLTSRANSLAMAASWTPTTAFALRTVSRGAGLGPTSAQPSTSILLRTHRSWRREQGRKLRMSTVAPTRPMSTIPRPHGAAKLHFVDFNPGVDTSDSTPVVIMHGLLGNSRNFQGWGAKLVKGLDRQRRVFAVDMRNHGASSHHESMTYVDMANDVLGFLADQGISRAVLIGHSMGGKAAAMTALLHPDVVEGLMIMDIAPVSYSVVDATNWGETQKIIHAVHKMPLDRVSSRRDADQLLATEIVDPALRSFAVTNLDKEAGENSWKWRVNVSAIHRSMGTLAQFGSGDEKRVSPYHGDALFVAGGNSRYIRSQHLKEIGALFPRYVLSTVKGAGHWVHADNPSETLKLAKSFLDRPELN